MTFSTSTKMLLSKPETSNRSLLLKRMLNSICLLRRILRNIRLSAKVLNFPIFSHPSNGKKLVQLSLFLTHPDNLDQFRNTTNQIVWLIHGWTNSRQSPWMEDLKNAFLIRDKNSFVIMVDWQEPANQLYYVSSINTYDVSKLRWI